MMMEDALIIREILGKDGDKFVVKEVWDAKHPDCPFVVMRTTPVFERNVDATVTEIRCLTTIP
jgi:hypothetical protein